MSYSAVYLINVDGKVFNSLLPPGESIGEEEINEYRENDILLEFSIPNTDQTISAEITGVVTLLWAPWRFSLFFSENQEKIDEAIKWENELLAFVSDSKVYRIDEILLEQWESEKGECWFREAETFQEIESWLGMKNKLHWQQLR